MAVFQTKNASKSMASVKNSKLIWKTPDPWRRTTLVFAVRGPLNSSLPRQSARSRGEVITQNRTSVDCAWELTAPAPPPWFPAFAGMISIDQQHGLAGDAAIAQLLGHRGDVAPTSFRADLRPQ
jgi:hypothetical protein